MLTQFKGGTYEYKGRKKEEWTKNFIIDAIATIWERWGKGQLGNILQIVLIIDKIII